MDIRVLFLLCVCVAVALGRSGKHKQHRHIARELLDLSNKQSQHHQHGSNHNRNLLRDYLLRKLDEESEDEKSASEDERSESEDERSTSEDERSNTEEERSNTEEERSNTEDEEERSEDESDLHHKMEAESDDLDLLALLAKRAF